MDGVTESINVFLDWAIGITTILVIYYIIKLLITGKLSKEEEAKLEERGEKVKEFIKKRKAVGEKKEKEKKLDPVKGLLINCVNAVEEGTAHINEGTEEGAKKARDEIKEFSKNIRIVWRELRILRNEAKGGEREALEKLAASAHNLVIGIKEKKLRESDISEWLRNPKGIINKLKWFKSICGEMITRLDDLMR